MVGWFEIPVIDMERAKKFMTKYLVLIYKSMILKEQ